jgi:hypothetical protein
VSKCFPLILPTADILREFRFGFVEMQQARLHSIANITRIQHRRSVRASGTVQTTTFRA